MFQKDSKYAKNCIGYCIICSFEHNWKRFFPLLSSGGSNLPSTLNFLPGKIIWIAYFRFMLSKTVNWWIWAVIVRKRHLPVLWSCASVFKINIDCKISWSQIPGGGVCWKEAVEEAIRSRGFDATPSPDQHRTILWRYEATIPKVRIGDTGILPNS